MTDLAPLKNAAAVIDLKVVQAGEIPPGPGDEIPPIPGSTDAPAPGGEAPAPEPVLSPEEEARSVIDLGVELAVPFYASLEAVYTPEVRDRLARAAAPLLKKYNISLGSIFARYKEEIDFAFVALPILLQTGRAIAQEYARKKLFNKDPREIVPGEEVPATDLPENAPLVAGGARS
jgi:hypothetical protein